MSLARKTDVTEGSRASPAAKAAGPPPSTATCSTSPARRARGESVTAIAKHLGVDRSTLYRALEEDEPPATDAGDD
jgi:transcriptional regulator of acetoin/glycerol metabolism